MYYQKRMRLLSTINDMTREHSFESCEPFLVDLSLISDWFLTKTRGGTFFSYTSNSRIGAQ